MLFESKVCQVRSCAHIFVICYPAEFSCSIEGKIYVMGIEMKPHFVNHLHSQDISIFFHYKASFFEKIHVAINPNDACIQSEADDVDRKQPNHCLKSPRYVFNLVRPTTIATQTIPHSAISA